MDVTEKTDVILIGPLQVYRMRTGNGLIVESPEECAGEWERFLKLLGFQKEVPISANDSGAAGKNIFRAERYLPGSTLGNAYTELLLHDLEERARLRSGKPEWLSLR